MLLGVLMTGPGPLQWLSTRFIIWGGPASLRPGAEEKATHALLGTLLRALPSTVVYVEFRNLRDMQTLFPVFHSHGFRFLSYLDLSIALTEGDPLQRFRPARRRQVVQARKAGIRVDYATEEAQVKEWYLMLKSFYLLKLRRPLPSLAFFLAAGRSWACQLLLARQEGKVLGGMLLCGLAGGTRYTWYVMSVRKGKGTASPMALLYAEAILRSAAEGYTSLNLMGGGKGDRPSGVRTYKLGFGPEKNNYGRFLLVRRPLVYALASCWVKR